MQNHKMIAVNILLVLIISSCSPTKKETTQFNIHFLTWGSLPFKKEITEDITNQKILYTIRNDFKSYLEIADDISVSVDTVVNRINQLSQYDLVVADETTRDRWISNIPIYDESEVRLAEKICAKYAKKEAAIFRHSLEEIRALYNSLAISECFRWDRMSWIVIGAFISDFVVIDRIRFFPEYRDEQFLPRLHPDGQRWSLTGYLNLDNISLKESRWSFYQAFVKDQSAGFSKFGFYRPKEDRKKPPKNPLSLGLADDGDILFSIHDKALSLEDIRNLTGIHQDKLEERIDYLYSLDPPAVIQKDGKYIANIPIFAKHDFDKLLLFADKIAATIHQDVIIPCKNELAMKAKDIGLKHPLPDGAFIRDIALRILVDEGVLPAVPAPPIPWDFGVWGWEGQLLLWEEVNTRVSAGTKYRYSADGYYECRIQNSDEKEENS